MVRTLVERARAWLRNSWVAQHVKMFMLGLGIGMAGSLIIPTAAHAQGLPSDTALANTIGGSLDFWKDTLKNWGRPVLGIAMFFGVVGAIYGAATGNKGVFGGMISLIAGAIVGMVLINWFLS